MTIKLSDPEAKSALADFQTPFCPFDHLVLGYADDINSLSVRDFAAGGLNALRSKLRASEVLFVLLRVQQKILLITSLGPDVGGVRRAQALVQSRALQAALGITVFASVTISRPADLTLVLVGSKLKLEGFEHVESPQLAEDFRASFLSSKSFDWRASRSRPSAPASPDASMDKVDVGRPDSDSLYSGIPMIPDDMLGLKKGAHDHFHHHVSSPSNSRDSYMQAWEVNKAINFDQDPEDEGVRTYDTCSSLVTSRASIHSPSHRPNRLGLSTQTLSSSTIGPKRVRSGDADTFGAGGSDRGSPQLLNEQEFRRISAERARIRADEAIREEVMKKLRQEQSAIIPPSPRLIFPRSPRPVQLPPPPPPPLSAPPQVPLPPSPPSPPAALLWRSTVDKQPSPSRRVVSLTDTLALSSPHRDSYEELAEQSAKLNSPRPSESRQSLRSVQTVEIWKAADLINSHPNNSRESLQSSEGLVLTQTHASLRLQSLALQSHGSVHLESFGCSVKRQPGCGSRTATPSSSKVSTLAPSLFDKDLPRPPPTQGADSLAPCSASTPSLSPLQDQEKTEIVELKAKLAQAEQRARDAEQTARIEIQQARQDSERFAKKLAQVERQRQEATQAEAVRRSKWAREQAARDQLDAFERSRLESEEKRRRATIAKQRQEQEEAARYAREMQKQREEEAERLKEEYERKLVVIAEREARLKAVAEEKEQQQRALIEQQDRRRRQQRAIVESLEEKLKDDDPTKIVLSGSLNVQEEGAIFWRKRWHELTKTSLCLYKSKEDSSAGIGALRSIDLKQHSLEISDGLEECTMRNSLKLESQQTAEAETCIYFMYADTEQERDTLKAALMMIRRSQSSHHQL